MIEKQEIYKALDFMNQHWNFQNNVQDTNTKFIYHLHSVDDLLKICQEKQIDKNYALHRWYNFNCAKWHEFLFCQNPEVRKEEDNFHKTIDFYINNVPFDLKASPFPKKMREKLDLKKRKDKNKLILWFYQNQSKQGRQHFENRLFIVCNNLKSKSNFELIQQKIRTFIDYSNQNGFNKIQVNEQEICSDIIFINN
ncbi:MAG: hypothetical protein EAZ97_02990 [Bacteroidetes bacterium]|nr:MAG: hypothetical protein EAZ97_02990 [Bacteroidota bacterium]